MFKKIMLRSIKLSKVTKPTLKFPEKFKGTIVEKWADYWKNLFIDYKQMLQDLRSDIQDQPTKAFKWATTLGTLYLLSKNNPNEIDFKNELRRTTNEVILVSEECRNIDAIEHLRFLQTSYNEGVIHYINLGIASVMYSSEFSDSCSIYKSQCSYMKPSYLSFPSRVIDVGIIGKWWNLYMKTANFDVNTQ